MKQYDIKPGDSYAVNPVYNALSDLVGLYVEVA